MPGTDCRQSVKGDRHPSVPQLTHTYNASDFLSLSGFAHFQKSRLHTSELCKRERYIYYLDCHNVSMPHKKRKTQRDNATRASVTKEMAKPRMAKSAKIAQLNFDTSRIPEQPSTTMPGTVDKIILSSGPRQSEKAQIAIDEADPRYRTLRIKNNLTDEHGDDVKLRKGAHVDVTVTARSVGPQLTKPA